MWKLSIKSVLATLVFFNLISSVQAWDKGIYLTQYMLEKPDKLNYFIREAKATGINTFIIDHEYFSPHYAPAIAKVKAAGLKNVTRIVVFSDGGNAKQVRSQAHWEEKFKLVQDAINAGADAVQLDYIRYSSKEPANPQHAKDVYQVIKWFKSKINAEKVPMEIDIFGEVSYYPSMHIGQDIKMFADSVDGVNPMVYPSHFWPFQKYSAEPYKTINNSLNALLGQFNHSAPFKVHAFIEAANYHYLRKTTNAQKQKYLLEEIHAVEDAPGVSGWYVWSANNVYDNLFQVLKNNKIKSTDAEVKEGALKAQARAKALEAEKATAIKSAKAPTAKTETKAAEASKAKTNSVAEKTATKAAETSKDAKSTAIKTEAKANEASKIETKGVAAKTEIKAAETSKEDAKSAAIKTEAKANEASKIETKGAAVKTGIKAAETSKEDAKSTAIKTEAKANEASKIETKGAAVKTEIKAVETSKEDAKSAAIKTEAKANEASKIEAKDAAVKVKTEAKTTEESKKEAKAATAKTELKAAEASKAKA